MITTKVHVHQELAAAPDIRYDGGNHLHGAATDASRSAAGWANRWGICPPAAYLPKSQQQLLVCKARYSCLKR